jgi:hypothetical protein
MTKSTKVDMSEVDEILAQIVSNWPSLYTTRYDALGNALTSSWPSWQETETGFIPRPSGIADGRDSLEDPTTERVNDILRGRPFETLKAWEQEQVYAARVSWGRRHAIEIFNREHAADIARNTSETFVSVPRFSLSDLDKIPLDRLDPAWRAALIEYCEKIERLSEDKVRDGKRDLNQEAQDRAASDLKSAKAAAKECLFRLGIADGAEIEQRAAEIAKLRAQAYALGLDLVERKGENV